jgi:hypothetical protein
VGEKNEASSNNGTCQDITLNRAVQVSKSGKFLYRLKPDLSRPQIRFFLSNALSLLQIRTLKIMLVTVGPRIADTIKGPPVVYPEYPALSCIAVLVVEPPIFAIDRLPNFFNLEFQMVLAKSTPLRNMDSDNKGRYCPICGAFRTLTIIGPIRKKTGTERTPMVKAIKMHTRNRLAASSMLSGNMIDTS